VSTYFSLLLVIAPLISKFAAVLHCRKSRPIFRDIPRSVRRYVTCSYIERNVPKLIVPDIFRNISEVLLRFKKQCIFPRDLIYCPQMQNENPLTTRLTMLPYNWERV
jgi:hypothetical protein